MFLHRNTHHLFLEFGHHLVKAAHGVQSGRTFMIQDFKLAPMPTKTYENAMVTSPLKFKECIFHVLGLFSQDAQAGDIHLSAADRYTFLKKITLPKPLPKNLDQHMVYEAEQIAPYPMAEAIVDYSVMDGDPFFSAYGKPGESQILTTISKHTLLQDVRGLFDEAGHPLTTASPASVGLLNVALSLLKTGEHARLVMAQLGECSALLLYVSPEHVRFMYYPAGQGEVIAAATKHCELTLSEGRYFAEHASEKDIPDVFSTAFKTSVSRYCETLCAHMVNLAEATPDQPVPVYYCGGPSRVSHVATALERAREIQPMVLNYTAHLRRKNIQLGPSANADDIATYFPSLIGHLEALIP